MKTLNQTQREWEAKIRYSMAKGRGDYRIGRKVHMLRVVDLTDRENVTSIWEFSTSLADLERKIR
jgi:hypothetical protein